MISCRGCGYPVTRAEVDAAMLCPSCRRRKAERAAYVQELKQKAAARENNPFITRTLVGFSYQPDPQSMNALAVAAVIEEEARRVR